MAPITKRRRSRELALQFLYAFDYDREPIEDVIKKVLEGKGGESEIVPFAREITRTVVEHEQEFDERIKETALNWDINRIAVLDKVIIRMALAEIYYFDSIPYKVSIDEAIELGKKFSTKESGKFINGILDAIGKRLKQK